MMNRKTTIWLAVLVNAGLLSVLFMTAVSSKEEPSPPADWSATPGAVPEPLFQEPVALPAQAPLSMPVETPLAILPPIVEEAAPLAPLPPAEPTRGIEPALHVTVKKGETLEKIAKANKTSVDEIIRINHLPSSFLRVGQVLKLPVGKGKEMPKGEAGADYYTVKVGDNPWTIAMKHHIKVEELLKLNGLNEEKARKLKPGDRLRVR